MQSPTVIRYGSVSINNTTHFMQVITVGTDSYFQVYICNNEEGITKLLITEHFSSESAAIERFNE